MVNDQPTLFDWIYEEKFNQYLQDKYVYNKGYTILDYRHSRTIAEHKQDEQVYKQIMKEII